MNSFADRSIKLKNFLKRQGISRVRALRILWSIEKENRKKRRKEKQKSHHKRRRFHSKFEGTDLTDQLDAFAQFLMEDLSSASELSVVSSDEINDEYIEPSASTSQSMKETLLSFEDHNDRNSNVQRGKLIQRNISTQNKENLIPSSASTGARVITESSKSESRLKLRNQTVLSNRIEKLNEDAFELVDADEEHVGTEQARPAKEIPADQFLQKEATIIYVDSVEKENSSPLRTSSLTTFCLNQKGSSLENAELSNHCAVNYKLNTAEWSDISD